MATSLYVKAIQDIVYKSLEFYHRYGQVAGIKHCLCLVPR
jgi:hypothetical protein